MATDYRKLGDAGQMLLLLSKPGADFLAEVQFNVDIYDGNDPGADNLMDTERRSSDQLPLSQFVTWGLLTSQQKSELEAILVSFYNELKTKSPRKMTNGSTVLEDNS